MAEVLRVLLTPECGWAHCGNATVGIRRMQASGAWVSCCTAHLGAGREVTLDDRRNGYALVPVYLAEPSEPGMYLTRINELRRRWGLSPR